MKSITTMLQRGSLTPKERVLLWVHDAVNKDLTGKEILTEADRQALITNWRPGNNWEIQEYNKYNDGFKVERGIRIDSQTNYLMAEISLLKTGRLVSGVMWEKYVDNGSIFKKIDLDISDDDALDFVIKNSGLRFDRIIYECTFLNLNDDVRQDILILCPDAETESQYLDQEEMVADLFNGKKQLTAEAKEKMTGLVVDAMYNKYAKAVHEMKLKYREWWFDGYFAELPHIEIVKKWADYNGMKYDADNDKLKDDLSEKMQDYVEKNKTTMRDVLRNTVSRWLDEGLFINEYSPIFNSDKKETCNDADTKLTHKEILKQWLVTKEKVKAMVQELIDDGRLQIESREIDFFGIIKETVKIVTGESLYNIEGDFVFTDDYRKQVDDLKPFGYLALFARNQDFFEDYASLLAFANMYKKLNEIYDIDLGYGLDERIERLKNGSRLLNRELERTTEKLIEAIYKKHNIKFLIEITDYDAIHIEDIKSGNGETETHYLNELKNLFGNEF